MDTYFFKGILSLENLEMGHIKIDLNELYTTSLERDIDHRLYHTPDPNDPFAHI